MTELLIVIAILSIVTIASIPMVIPALSSRAVREAARIVNTQFAAAQAQALATGRPAGVWIERLNGEPTAAMDLYLAEVPPPYAGQTVDETVNVQIAGGVYAATGTVTFSSAGFYPLLRPGDLIRFNHSGPYYQLSEAASVTSPQDPINSELRVLDNDTTTNPNTLTKTITYLPTDLHFRMPPAAYPPTGGGGPFPGWTTTYEVFRQPVKSASGAVQLPTGAIIDLIDSGVGNSQLYQLLPCNAPPGLNVLSISNTATNQAKDDDRLRLFTSNPANPNKPNGWPIVFMFNSSGALDSVCFSLTNPTAFGGVPKSMPPIALTSPVYLMIGKRDKVMQQAGGAYSASYYNPADSASQQADKQNFRDLENLWIVVNPQSGSCSTAVNTDVDDSAVVGAIDHDRLNDALTKSRLNAQSAQAAGGR